MLAGQVADVGDAAEGQQVVLAERREGDARHHHQLVVAAVVGEGGGVERLRRQEFREHARDPGRRVCQAGAVAVQAERVQQLRDRGRRAVRVDGAGMGGHLRRRPRVQCFQTCRHRWLPRHLVCITN